MSSNQSDRWPPAMLHETWHKIKEVTSRHFLTPATNRKSKPVFQQSRDMCRFRSARAHYSILLKDSPFYYKDYEDINHD